MESIRNKLGWGLSGALALLLLAALAGVVHGGPLDPTAPPGSTGKNVITALPFTISQPGSYVLNSNLTGVSGQNGITVNAGNVTIDLQGFELVGAGGALSGIAQNSGANVSVEHGTIRNWPAWGISAGDGSVIDDLHALQNGRGMVLGSWASVSNCEVQGSTASYGIRASEGATITHCRVEGNAPGGTSANGIEVGGSSTITETVARNNGGTEILAGDKVTLENCVADGVGTPGNGIQVGFWSSIRGCSAFNNGGVEILAGWSATLENCVADGNVSAEDGIRVGQDSTIRGCTARNNGGEEIEAASTSVLVDCVADGLGTAGYGILVGENSRVSGCTARNNGDTEIATAGDRVLIENCIADGWTGSAKGAGNGILLGHASTVRGCTLENNGNMGIWVNGGNNRIEGNHVRANSQIGIYVPSVGNFVALNDSALNGAGASDNCAAAAGNDFVMVFTATGANSFDNVCD